jgi:excisionase family DNA binding protein
MERVLITIEEAMDYLDISRAEIYRMINRGQIHRVKLGRRAFIHRDALEAFVHQLVSTQGDEA